MSMRPVPHSPACRVAPTDRAVFAGTLRWPLSTVVLHLPSLRPVHNRRTRWKLVPAPTISLAPIAPPARSRTSLNSSSSRQSLVLVSRLLEALEVHHRSLLLLAVRLVKALLSLPSVLGQPASDRPHLCLTREPTLREILPRQQVVCREAGLDGPTHFGEATVPAWDPASPACGPNWAQYDYGIVCGPVMKSLEVVELSELMWSSLS
jgi:hypothetical protein